MTDFPENEKITNQNTEETSTVFSAPVQHTKKSNNVKKKKRLPIVISCLLAVAVLVGGTLAIKEFIPEREEETSSTPEIKSIEVLNMKADELATVTVANSSGTFNLYSEEEKSQATTSGENTTVAKWYLKDYEKDVISSSSLSSIAGSAASISASREVTERTAADCGLENPAIKVDVTTKKDKAFSILFGNESPDKSGYYLKLSDSDKIYVVDSSVKQEFDFAALDLADSSSMPGIETDDSNYKNAESGLVTFDSLSISGKNFANPILITPNKDNRISSFAQFIVSSPEERIAENVDKVFAIFNTGLTVEGAYSFDVSNKSLAAVGLNNPDFTATMKIKDTSLTYKFKLQPDGYYAAICDGVKLIKKVNATSIPFIDYTTTDFYSSWVCLNSIDDLKNLTFIVGEKTYDFSITANPDEEAEEKYIVKIDGKTIKSEKFQNFYQQCISLTCNDYNIKDINTKPDYSIIFTFKDEIGGKQTVDFVKSDATRYQYSLNGIDMGRVNSSALNQIFKSLENLCNDK